jgi:hypothetical protein
MNLDDLRAEGAQLAPKRHTTRRKERFLKGPVPWPWLVRAMKLPGRALHVGIYVWFFAGMSRSETVVLTMSRLQRELGFSRATATRGLAALEAADLVSVERATGRAPRVTIRRAE